MWLQLALNEFADLTWEEFRRSKLGVNPDFRGNFRLASTIRSIVPEEYVSDTCGIALQVTLRPLKSV